MKKQKKRARKINRQALTARSLLTTLGWGAAMAALAWACVFFSSEPAVQAAADAAGTLVISEVMSANEAACPAPNGGYYDWVELWNPTQTSISMRGWTLCASIDTRGAYALPDAALAPDARVVIYLTRERVSGLDTAGFSLDKDGANLFLSTPDGAVAQALEIPALRKGEVYALNAAGEFERSAFYTPGYENSEAAYRALISRTDGSAGLVISEVMAANGATLADAAGAYPDWIEIANLSDAPVRLYGWSLSTRMDNRREWAFPDVTLEAGAYLIVFADGEGGGSGELRASFKLSSAGETLCLIDPQGNIADRAEYEALAKDVSLSRQPNGTRTTQISPSPGYENSEYGAERSLGTAYRSVSSNAQGLYINEIMCSMSGYSDWLELYNGGGASVDLSGWWLSDSTDHPRKWAFPQGTTIVPGEYKLVFLIGDDEAESYQSGYLCASFELNKAGGEVAVLAAPDGAVVDAVKLRGQKSNVSYGRADGQSQYRFFSQMTPGAANAGESYARCAAQVAFSETGGLKSAPLTLTLRAEDGLTIYYTTDGSKPTAASSVYTGPLQLSSTSVIKAIAWSGDVLASDVVANTYLFGEQTALRVVCVSGERGDLNGSGGVLNTASKASKEVCVEIYDYDGTQLIDQGCELTMAGKGSRVQFPQKSFRLVAKSKYGDSLFRAPLFTKRDYTEYNAVVLRTSGQDTEKTHMRDSILTSLAEDTDVFYQETELAVVYVNGEYWGMYNLRERVDISAICQFEGWEREDEGFDLLEGKSMSATHGSNANFAEMMRFVHKEGLSSDANIEKLRTYCDIENYLDYVAIQIYTANEDLGNVRAYRNTYGDGLWRWALFDLDLSFANDKNSFSMWLSSSGEAGSVTQQNSQLFYELMKNADMRDYFLTRFGELLSTTFSSENLLAKINARYEAIVGEIGKTCERWGWSLSSWKRYGASMVNYAQSRPAKLITYAQSAFKLTDAQVTQYFGAAIAKINAGTPPAV